MRRIFLVAAAGALLAGCSSEEEQAPQRETRTAQAQDQPCELYLGERGVFVRVAGEGAAETCRRWEGSPAPGGRWSLTADSGSEDRFERVCVVYQGKTSAGLYATPTIATNGRAKEICGDLISRGWGELSGPSEPTPPEPQPSDLAPVRCSEGRCSQGGKPVARPEEGRLCDGGAWTYAGLTRDQEAGSWRCLPDPRPRDSVVCDRLVDTCRQDGGRVYPPRAGARCAQGGREWQRTAGRGTKDVYRCERRRSGRKRGGRED